MVYSYTNPESNRDPYHICNSQKEPRYNTLIKIIYVKYNYRTILVYEDTWFVPELTQNAPGILSISVTSRRSPDTKLV